MKWYKAMAVGESLGGHLKYYQFRIRYTDKPVGVYCILLSENGHDLLEITHCEALRDPKLYKEDRLVLGLAGSKKEACLMAGQMAAEVLRETGGLDLKAYYSGN